MPALARAFFRVHERLLRRDTFSILRQLETTQWLPRVEIDLQRLDRLRALVGGAHEHCSYWRGVMDQRGIAPADIRRLGDLGLFPLLEKQTLRARREEMVWREEGPGLRLTRTSGSTNEALQFYSNSSREAQINAARIRGHRWVGIDKGDKEMYFWGSPVELSRQDRLKRLRDWFVNDGLTNGFVLNPELVRQCLGQWRRWRPKCIFGYPSSLVLLIRMLARSTGVPPVGTAETAVLPIGQLKGRGLACICTTSEMLTAVDRRLIAEAFGVPVYDSYGLREAGLVGHECRHGTMHTMDEQMILETIDPVTLQPTTQEGELVVTSLISQVMPVIRYRTGDMVTLSEQACPCGLALRSITVSGGRVAEFVVTNQGKWVVGYSFIYIARSVKGVVKFQVRQERPGQVRVLLVVDGQFPPDGREQIARAVRARLASDDEISVELVDDIEPAPSGKYRPVVSAVAEQLLKQGRSPGADSGTVT